MQEVDNSAHQSETLSEQAVTMVGLGTIHEKCHAKRGRRGVRKVGHYGKITRV